MGDYPAEAPSPLALPGTYINVYRLRRDAPTPALRHSKGHGVILLGCESTGAIYYTAFAKWLVV